MVNWATIRHSPFAIRHSPFATHYSLFTIHYSPFTIPMRLFVGIELDDAVRAAASDVAERLRQRLKRSRVDLTARWVEPANLHITLWFLGELTDERFARVSAVMAVPFATNAYLLAVNGCGAFPASGAPRNIWLGVSAGRQSTAEIHDELKGRLGPIGFEAEKRPYTPHLTIARVKDIRRQAAHQLRTAMAAVPADCGSCRIEGVTLFRSRLSPSGSRYEPLLRVPLS
jgi:RNA 2',3'-cyclic 3'-phosphodiesterase